MTSHATGIPSLTIVTEEGPVELLMGCLQIIDVTRPVDQPRHELEKNMTSIEGRIRRALMQMRTD